MGEDRGMIGQTLSNYRIVGKLGEGGMGVVYDAVDLRLDRRVALKFLPLRVEGNGAERQRLLREAKAVSALDHANICSLHTVEETADGRLFLVMARYEGRTLRQRLAAGPLPAAEALDTAGQVLLGLAAAHRLGIVHRDLSSGNVMLTNSGAVKIMDFGLARMPGAGALTQTGQAMGTVACMSPEQARGEPVDQRTDLWAAGVLLYEMLAGRPPFQGEYAPAVVYSILHEEPAPLSVLRPDLPPGLDGILQEALAKDPEKRYQQAEDFLADLQAVQSDRRLPGKAGRGKRAVPVRRLGWLAVAVLLAAMGIVAAVMLWPESRPPVEAVAVLPMEDLSGVSPPDLFADAVTEELIASLSKIGALRVVSRSSVLPYRGTRKPIRQICRELGVDAVVEGTVRRAGDRARVTARLVTGLDERTLWSDAYERQSSDVLKLQSDVAQALAGEIRIAVTPQERARLADARPVDTVAFQLYLKGRYYFEKWSADGSTRAIEYFHRALERDPSFARAYAGLADCYLEGPSLPLPIQEGLPKARDLAKRALALDPELAEAHSAMGYVLYCEWDFPRAEAEFRRAIELNANLPAAHHHYSHFLLSMGRVEESLAESRKNLSLDPVSPAATLHMGYHYLSAGQLDLAEKWNRKALAMDPNYYRGHIQLGQTLEDTGRSAEAVEEYLRAFTLSGEENADGIAELRRGFRKGGLKEFYRIYLAHTHREDPKENVYPVGFAEAYARLGQADDAFRCLEAAFRQHSPRLINMKENVELASLRADPRFTDLLRRMKLPL